MVNDTPDGYSQASYRMETTSTPRINNQTMHHRAAAVPFAVWLFFGLLLLTALTLLLAPWPAELKFQAVLHGLCAQRPSHSFALGGVNLPFDARMTGIYGGCLISLFFLLARGRWRAVGRPSWPLLGALGGFVVLLGLDGVNSTLLDLRLPYAYEPQNWLRLLTGLLMGITLAVLLLYLLNATLWAWLKPTPLIANWWELGALILLAAGFGALVATGWGWLYFPLALTLIGSAITVALILSLSMLTLIRGRENRAERASEVAGTAVAALLIAYIAIALIAIGRWYLETVLGLPPLL